MIVPFGSDRIKARRGPFFALPAIGLPYPFKHEQCSLLHSRTECVFWLNYFAVLSMREIHWAAVKKSKREAIYLDLECHFAGIFATTQASTHDLFWHVPLESCLGVCLIHWFDHWNFDDLWDRKSALSRVSCLRNESSSAALDLASISWRKFLVHSTAISLPQVPWTIWYRLSATSKWRLGPSWLIASR